jgi:hypothetical protein
MIKNKWFLLLLFMGVLIPWIANAQPYAVNFNIQDEKGAAIENAILTFNGVDGTAGNYVLADTDAGTYNFRVTKEPDYVWKGGSVSISSDTTILVILAERAAYFAKLMDTPPVIGEDNSAIWDKTAFKPISTLNELLIGDTVSSEGIVKAVYDANYLYLLLEIKDDTLVYNPDDWKVTDSDEVEIYIDGRNEFNAQSGNKAFPRFDIGKYQMGLNLGSDSLRGWGEGDGADGTIHTFDRMYEHGVEWVMEETETGYKAEIRLPWLAIFEDDASLVEALAPGDYVSMNFNIRDYDTQGNLKSQVVWANHPYKANSNAFGNHPFSGSQHWGSIQLLPLTNTVIFDVKDDEGNPISNTEITLDGVQYGPGEYIFELTDGTYNYRVQKETDFVWKGGSITVTGEDMNVEMILAERAGFQAKYTPEPMNIGEAVNDDIWRSIVPANINTLNELAGTELSNEGTFKAVYDKDFLYVLIEVKDNILVYNTDDWTIADSDEAEIYIDGRNEFNPQSGNRAFPRFDEGKYQMGFMLGADSLRGWGEGDGADGTLHTFDRMYRQGIDWLTEETESGYKVEVRIPWLGIFEEDTARVEALVPGDFVSMNFNIRDYDLQGTLNSQVVWANHPYKDDTNQFGNHPFSGSQHWGAITLSADTVENLPEYEVTFNVTDDNGNVVDDAVIELGLKVNQAGEYTFNTIAGEYAYSVSRADYYKTEGTVIVTGDTDIDITLAIIPTYTVTFNVTDQNGNTINDAVITYRAIEYPAGTYVFTDQRPGTYNYFAGMNDDLIGGIVNVIDTDVTVDVVFTIETGVGMSAVSAFRMYPNPLSDTELVIEFGENDQNVTLKVSNITGKTIYMEDILINKSEVVIPSSLFEKGVYFIQLQNNLNHTTKKLIVK